MKQYHICRIFNRDGEFDETALKQAIHKQRKYLLIYLPRSANSKSVNAASKALKLAKVSVCVHDLTFLNAENDVHIGRNLQNIFTMIRLGVRVEALSYHLGSFLGFGANAAEEIVASHLELKLPAQLEDERFLCSTYDRRSYKESIDTLLEYLFNISQFAYKNKLKLLIKNLAMDYIYVTDEYKRYFSALGYEPEGERGVGLIPKIIEKGEFPRSAKEMKLIAEMYDMKIALDVEHLLFNVIFSKLYNAQNIAFLKRWKIVLNDEDKRMFVKYGFTVRKGRPIIYEKPLDIVDEIISLKNYIYIAHVAGSVGPIFLDKPGLKEEDVTPKMLLGLVGKDDAKYARKGKEQLATYSGVIDTTYSQEKYLEEDDEDTYTVVKHKKLFESEDAMNVWRKMFNDTFTRALVTLKEIGVKRIVNKTRSDNENVNDTYKMFRFFMSR